MEQIGVASANDEAIEAWNGPLFDRFSRFRHVLTAGLGAHGDEALRRHPPAAGDRVLDIGCGFGDTALRLAGMVGDEGSVVGIDAAERFIGAARADAAEAGAENVRFVAGDVQATEFGEPFDYAFSRMGTMFFANPVAAMRNVHAALRPDGRLCMIVWRRKLDNEWMYGAEIAVKEIVDEPDETDEPTCGPGPFSMADADTTSSILLAAGFHDIELARCDLPILVGRDIDEAVDLVMSLGPAGERVRLAGDAAVPLLGQVDAAVRDVMSEWAGPDGVRAGASTWLVSARA